MTSKRVQRKHRERERILSACKPPPVLCPICGKPGPHYVPPSFGSPGWWMCEVTDEPIGDLKIRTYRAS